MSQCRKLLEVDIARQLRFYGVNEKGFVGLEELSHLSDEGLQVRRRLEEAIEKEKVGGLTVEQAIQRYIRHVSFTYLNRLAALRAMEVRGLIKETVMRRPEYGGRSLRERDIVESNPGMTSDQALKRCLIDAFEEVGEEIKVLFDLKNEYSLIFPEVTTLREVIHLLTKEVSEQDWKEDDIIGWIYQYFNDEARQEFRKARRKPLADDIPVINQFYTPHWIVKALVDNTLGRLWLEMHPDSKVKEFCTYHVPLKNGNKREIKRVREIKVLDPACGSGHFLVYAFDVLYLMYVEDEPDTPPSEIPTLILENNLFGIDIDLRAVQLAALSLYLKAKTYNPSLKVRKMNLVCADVRVSDGKRRQEFLERFKDDPNLQMIFEKLLVDLGYTYEIGSLLKVRQPFEQLFRERKQGQKQTSLSFALTGQTRLSEGGLAGQTSFLAEASNPDELSLVLIIPKERTIEEMLQELRKFEQEAFEAQDMSRLLFATEAEKSVGLLALLSEKYDVVLMNPPYGDMPSKTKEYLQDHYPKTHFDYYAAFIEQAIDLAEDSGYVGALTGRTFMFLKSYQWIREVLLKERAQPQVVFDLGFGVLDIAMARWAAFTAIKGYFTNTEELIEKNIIFARLTQHADELAKRSAWEEALKAMKEGKRDPIIYQTTLQELSDVPSMPYSYWGSTRLRSLFKIHPPLDKDLAGKPDQIKIANLVVGLQTSEDSRFVRRFYEVFPASIGHGKKWAPFLKGRGAFYCEPDLVVEWSNNGQKLKSFPKASVSGEPYYFKEGLSWPDIVSSLRLNMRVIPDGLIFDNAAQALFPSEEKFKFSLLALCNSLLFAFLFMLLDPSQHHRRVGYVAKIPVALAALESERLRSLAHEAYDILKEWYTGNEVSTLFVKPWILQVLHGSNSVDKPITQHPLAGQFEWSNWPSAQEIRSIRGSPESSLKELAELCVKRQLMLNKRIEEIQREIDDEVYRIYGISDEDRALIERELALQQGISLEEEETEESKAEEAEEAKGVISAEEHVKRLVSYYVKRAIESDEDGIVPLNEIFPDNLVGKVRQQIIADFGRGRLDKIERELEEILGKTLAEWLAQDYFDFHVTLYRRRPIFWQLTSERFGSGRNRSPVFSCFLYYHKLTRDTIPKVGGLYLPKIKEHLEIEKDHISRELASASEDKRRESQLKREYEQISDQLKELEKFDAALIELHRPRQVKTNLSPNAKWVERAIAEVRDEGWRPIIDHGVRVNIEPLKELGLPPKAAERVK